MYKLAKNKHTSTPIILTISSSWVIQTARMLTQFFKTDFQTTPTAFHFECARFQPTTTHDDKQSRCNLLCENSLKAKMPDK